MFKIYDEPEVFRIDDEPESPNERACLRCDEPPVPLDCVCQWGGAAPPPTPPLS